MSEYLVNTSIPIQFELAENQPYIDTERFQTVKIWICHTGLNLNNSVFTKSVLESMIPSLVGIPILGFVVEKSDGKYDFSGHEQVLIIKDGDIEIKYIGQAYGTILETNNAKFEKRTFGGVEREYLTCEGILWKKFTDCISIFDDNASKAQSMELHPPSIQGKFQKDGTFMFASAKFEGLCILGDDVIPAMTGSVVEKFSFENAQYDVKNILAEIKESIDTFNFEYANNNGKGGSRMDEKVKLLEQFGLSIDSIDFSIDEMSIEDLESKLNEFASANTDCVEVDVVEESTVDGSFAMSNNSLESEIRKELRKFKKISQGWDGNSYEENMFYLIDIVDTVAIVMSSDWDACYGIPFTVNGDFVSVDVESKTEYVSEWREKKVDVDVAHGIFSASISEFSDAVAIKNVPKDIFDQKIAEIEVVANNANAEKEILFSENESLKSENESMKAVVAELTSYKLSKENEIQDIIKNELFEKYESLVDSSILEAIKLEKDNFSVDEIENKLALHYARKSINFSVENFSKPTNVIKVKIDNTKDDSASDLPYNGLIEKYGK